MKQCWPAPERNKRPILEVLRTALPAEGTVLEIASGSGQHVVFFASELPHLTFQPSDCDPQNLASIAAHVRDAGLANVREPLALDVLDDWPVAEVDALFNANLIHIAPWACCEALLSGAARVLCSGGPLVIYGPFRMHGAHTAPSNEAFDAQLKAKDARFGVRDLEAVVELGERHGLRFEQRVAMPSNNQTLVFRR